MIPVTFCIGALFQRVFCVPMLSLGLHELNLKLGALSRELFEELILLAKLYGELICFHVECRCLKLRLNELLFDLTILNAHILKFLVQLLILCLHIKQLLLELFLFLGFARAAIA